MTKRKKSPKRVVAKSKAKPKAKAKPAASFWTTEHTLALRNLAGFLRAWADDTESDRAAQRKMRSTADVVDLAADTLALMFDPTFLQSAESKSTKKRSKRI